MSENEKAIPAGEGKFKRSPGFPAIPIDEAIESARKVYRADKRAFTTLKTLVEHLGYQFKGKGGRSGRKVAALKQYGLLDERSGQFRISDLAYKILEMAEDSPQKAALVKQAAMSPHIIRKVFNHFEGELPSDSTIRDYLLFGEGFNADAARDFIRVLRRTKELVSPTAEDYTYGEEPEGAEPPPSGATPMRQSPPPTAQTELGRPSPEFHRMMNRQAVDELSLHGVDVERLARQQAAQQELRYPIGRNSTASVIFDGPVTQEAIAKLIVLLEASQDTFPTKAELERPKRPEPVPPSRGASLEEDAFSEE